MEIIRDGDTKVVLEFRRVDFFKILFESSSEIQNPSNFLTSLDISELRDLPSFSVINIIRQPSQQTELRNQKNSPIVPILCLNQWLFLRLNSQPILPQIITLQRLMNLINLVLPNIIIKHHLIHNPILCCPIIRHHSTPNKSFLHSFSFLLLRQMLTLTVDVGDLFEDSFSVDNF